MNFPRAGLSQINAALALALITSYCASPLAQRAQRADGLLGFIFDYPGPDIVPVERVSRAGGEIATAHAVPEGQQLRVSGLVRKRGLHDPPYGSHVDILVLDARWKVLASTAADYSPRHFPRRIRGNMGTSLGTSFYMARLPSIPPAGSTVRVVFHGSSKAKCELRHGVS